jgi:cytochrome P450
VRCLFGLEVGDGGPELGELAEALQDDISSPLGMLIRYPIPGTPFHRSLETSAQLVRRMQALIDDKRRRPPSDDVLSLMIHAHDEDGSSFTDDELMGEATGLFIAGHETTAKTLVWTLFLLEQHPEVLAGAVDEIEAVLRGAPPTFGDLDELPSVDRIVKEGMRLLAVSALLFPRSCAEDVPLGSHRLPKGANVLVSPLITHRDAAVFPSPMRFLPERWNDLKPSIYEYLPFGGGARMCLGAPLGALIVRLLLTMILQRYRLSLAEGAVVSRQVRGNVLWPKHGLPVRLAKQDRALARPRPVRGDIHELVALPQR